MQNNYSLTNDLPLDTRKVKVLMAKQAKRLNDLVEIVRLPQSTISNHIAGRSRNRLIQKAIAEALGVSLNSLLLHPEPATAEQSSAA